ncbi:hypothetical protein [Hymenobacter crusticola]|nr:hypothetical protein [Hymenobacter crusticola]
MRKKACSRLLLVLGSWLLFRVPTHAQYTIHDHQIEEAKNWLARTLSLVFLLGLAAPLLLSALTYWVLEVLYPYHTAKATLGLWLSCGIWWLGWGLALANTNPGLGIASLLVVLTMGASAAGYVSTRQPSLEE